MTDKELKKLSRLELLELLLVESRENERLREELAIAKKENSIEKSLEHLNDISQRLETVLQSVLPTTNALIDNTDKIDNNSNKQ